MARKHLILFVWLALGASALGSSPSNLIVSASPDPSVGRSLKITITNRSSRKVTATAKVDMIGNRTDTISDVALGARETTTLTIPNAQPATTALTIPLPVAVSVTAVGGEAEWSGNVHFWSARRGADGPPLLLASAQLWQSQDGTWTGPNDLSAKATARYDDRALYLRAEVTDDVFHQPFSLGEAWKGDGLQIAIDPNWSRRSDATESVEFGLALTPGGPQVYRSTPLVGVMPGATLSVKRDGDCTTYDAAIPWSQLGVKAVRPPRTIGFALLLNDNDGGSREGWLSYGDGIAAAKRADRYGTLTLLP
ncbi:MAG TPA: sugar-binding protein [Armatimonadota bacterium]|jgi:hypothetical protein